jgi:acyl-coenzyme A thioesterase PaaI-like protein
MSSDTALTAPPAGFGVFAQDGVAATDFARMRAVANSIVPFGRFVGVEITEISPDQATVEIPDREYLTNQMGTVHAGAMFLAADIAGAAAFVGAMAPRIGDVAWLVVRDGSSTFRHPARGRVRAIATVDERETRRARAESSARRFDLDGKARLYDDSDTLVAVFRFGYVCEIQATPTDSGPTNSGPADSGPAGTGAAGTGAADGPAGDGERR